MLTPRDTLHELHVYEVMGDDDRAFELVAVAHDDTLRLSTHPESGRPLRPLFGAPGLTFEHAAREHGNVLVERTIGGEVRAWFVQRDDSFVRVEAPVASR
jgi:hypothetical protein